MSQFVGLFVYSNRAAIRNIILGSSCTVVSSYTGSNAVRIGGIIGPWDDCIVENNVNMASVIFTGSTTNSHLYIGGIVGYLYYSSNCDELC